MVDEATAKAIAGMMRVRELDELSGALRPPLPIATLPTAELHAPDYVLVLRARDACVFLIVSGGGGG